MTTARFQRYRPQAQQFGARTVLFQQAAASRLGLTSTELETFRLVQHEGPVTASALARQTGLTGASMSVIVEKLVKKGYLTRKQDDDDRRRWLLSANAAAVDTVEAIYAPHARRVENLLAPYSDRDFDVVLGFLRMLADELKFTAIELAQDGDADVIG